jgi:hypothetical protein
MSGSIGGAAYAGRTVACGATSGARHRDEMARDFHTDTGGAKAAAFRIVEDP